MEFENNWLNLEFFNILTIQSSPVTSANVGISPQNFLTFNFNPFATLMSDFKAIHSAIPKLLNLNQDFPSKTVCFFGVKSL